MCWKVCTLTFAFYINNKFCSVELYEMYFFEEKICGLLDFIRWFYKLLKVTIEKEITLKKTARKGYVKEKGNE